MAEEIWRWGNRTGLYSLLSTMLTIALSNCGGSKNPFISIKAGRGKTCNNLKEIYILLCSYYWNYLTIEKIANYEQVIPITSVAGKEDVRN